MGKLGIPEFDSMPLADQEAIWQAVGLSVVRDPAFFLPWIAAVVGFVVLLVLLPSDLDRSSLLALYFLVTSIALGTSFNRIKRRHVSHYLKQAHEPRATVV